MVWTIDDTRAIGTEGIPSAAMRTYYQFRHLIRDDHLAPSEALEQVDRDTHLEIYNSGRITHSIRLSQRHRVFMNVDQYGQIVTVLQIGGHDPRVR